LSEIAKKSKSVLKHTRTYEFRDCRWEIVSCRHLFRNILRCWKCHTNRITSV